MEASSEVVPVPGPSRFVRGGAVVALVILGLSGCGSAADAPVAPTSTSPAPVTSFAALPASALPGIRGATWADSTEAQQALARTHVGRTLSAFDGGISRDLVVDGTRIGGLQVYRFAPDVARTEYSRFPPMMVYTFAGATPTQQQIGGKTVQVVPSAGGTSHAVVAWTVEDQVMILWADDLATAKEYAARCILGSF